MKQWVWVLPFVTLACVAGDAAIEDARQCGVNNNDPDLKIRF